MVSNKDFKYLNQFSWKLDKHGYVHYRNGDDYIFMHRLILFGENDNKKLLVDHKNHNVLDNQRNNLRKCTYAQNLWNRNKFKNNKSGHKGIYWHKANKKWAAQIQVNGNKIHLGSFLDINDAITARKDAEILHHKDFRMKG